ncbi:MAG TPA: DCC1-like thiol-disulfide oxidoreductase family protein, partial [Tepidiformaceae bacterium]|nr:DCC1-like thiol-disulfide oxidoreductase family protein [Tepidiformaceae bacterium]
RWIGRRARRPLDLVGLSAYDVNDGYLGALTPAERGESAHLVTPRGVEYHGGEAITRALRLWRWGWLVRPLDWPGLSLFRAMGYRLVARNRGRIPGWLLPR